MKYEKTARPLRKYAQARTPHKTGGQPRQPRRPRAKQEGVTYASAMIGRGGGWERSGATDGEGARNGGVTGVRSGSKSGMRACGSDDDGLGGATRQPLYGKKAVSPSTNGGLCSNCPAAVQRQTGAGPGTGGPYTGLPARGARHVTAFAWRECAAVVCIQRGRRRRRRADGDRRFTRFPRIDWPFDGATCCPGTLVSALAEPS